METQNTHQSIIAQKDGPASEKQVNYLIAGRIVNLYQIKTIIPLILVFLLRNMKKNLRVQLVYNLRHQHRDLQEPLWVYRVHYHMMET